MDNHNTNNQSIAENKSRMFQNATAPNNMNDFQGNNIVQQQSDLVPNNGYQEPNTQQMSHQWDNQYNQNFVQPEMHNNYNDPKQYLGAHDQMQSSNHNNEWSNDWENDWGNVSPSRNLINQNMPESTNDNNHLKVAEKKSGGWSDGWVDDGRTQTSSNDNIAHTHDQIGHPHKMGGSSSPFVPSNDVYNNVMDNDSLSLKQLEMQSRTGRLASNNHYNENTIDGRSSSDVKQPSDNFGDNWGDWDDQPAHNDQHGVGQSDKSDQEGFWKGFEDEKFDDEIQAGNSEKLQDVNK